MFLRSNTRSKDGKAHRYWSLVETVRTPSGPRQRTVRYLKELNDPEQTHWQRTIEVFKALLSTLHSADIVLPTRTSVKSVFAASLLPIPTSNFCFNTSASPPDRLSFDAECSGDFRTA